MNADLNQLLIFARVVERGSFIAAAQALALPKTTVSRKVQELETRLGTRLLQRTTRKLALTEAGTIYYDYCARICQELEEAEHAVGRVQQAPRGTLRIAATISFGSNILVPMLPDFMARYPEVRVHCDLRNDPVDLISQGYDIVVRIGAQADSTHVSRKLGQTRMHLYASADYLARHGIPNDLDELRQHDVLALTSAERSGRYQWQLTRDEQQYRTCTLAPRLVANDPLAVKYAALAGRGIALLPEILVRQEVNQGALLPVLPEWQTAPAEFHAVFASRRGLPAKVRVFMDFLVEYIAELPAMREAGSQ